jgi:hypothetical protein
MLMGVLLIARVLIGIGYQALFLLLYQVCRVKRIVLAAVKVLRRGLLLDKQVVNRLLSSQV